VRPGSASARRNSNGSANWVGERPIGAMLKGAWCAVKSRMPRSEAALSPLDTDALWDAIGHAIGDRDFEALTPDELVDLAQAVPPLLPPELCRRIIEFRRRAPGGDVLLLRGLMPSHVTFPATVTAPSAPPSGPAQRAALLLVGIAGMLGEPFNYRGNYGGRLVQNLVPVRAMEFTQTGRSSSVMLDWHVEDGFREDRCDYVGLICLRGDPAAASQYAQVKDLQLPPALAATLREQRFHTWPAPADDLPDDLPKRRVAVLTGPAAAPEIVYDTHHIAPIDDSDTEAAAALRALHTRLDEVRMSHVMSSGDLLIFDNKRVVHSRTPFTARFDGTDRWLMRTMVCGSTSTFRTWGDRIVEWSA
jgi:L-asparagine oxygenase